MAKRKKKHEEEEHCEGWIVSYADLMTLLMGFFVVLLSMAGPMSAETNPDFAELVSAIREAFKYVPPVDSKDPIDLELLLRKLKNAKGESGATGRSGESSSDARGVMGKHDLVTTIRTGSQTTIGGLVPFDALSSELSDHADSRILLVSEQIKGHTNVFVVKGHTSRDEEYELRDTGRDLSYERANAVMKHLVKLGVAPQALRVESCRDFEPRKEGAYSEIARADNRRVEVIATEALVFEYQGEYDPNTEANKVMKITKELDKKPITLPPASIKVIPDAKEKPPLLPSHQTAEVPTH